MLNNKRSIHCSQPLLSSVIVALILILVFQPIITLAGQRGRSAKNAGKIEPPASDRMSEMAASQHALSRISFGLRTEDLEHLQTIGISAYITEQLNPESIDDHLLAEKLSKLPSLELAAPARLERYNTANKPAPAKPNATADKPTENVVAPKPNQPDAQMKKDQPADQTAMTAKAGDKNISKDMSLDMPKDMSKDMSKDMPKDSAAKPNQVTGPKPPMPPNPQQAIIDLQRAAFLRAVYSNRQLYERLVDFWENHFSIFSNKDADRWLLTDFDRDSIRPFALGRFRDLLGATAHSPAMLFYLDNWQSSLAHTYPASKDKPARTVGGLNENYARELMELHTLGVDGGYTQQDVQEVARCFTGWTIRKPNEEGLFVFNPQAHDNGEKIVLGQRIPAGGGISDGERVLDILARHPATAHFIATKLARRFLADDPPATVIERAATVFLQTDGSIRETLRAILTSPEFFAQPYYRAKLKSPFEYAVSAVRVLAVETDGDRPMLDWIARMGEPIFGRLTPDGYPDRAETWLANGLLVERLNFSIALASNKIAGSRFDPVRLLTGVNLDNPRAVVDYLSRLALADQVARQTREALEKAVQDANLTVKKGPENVKVAFTAKPSPPAYLATVIALVIGAPEFQRR